MAWYYGKYACGCEGRVNIIGSGKDREWKKEYAFSHECPDCHQRHLEEKRQEENEKSARKSEEMELLPLEGTEKQVAWAATIRIKMLDMFSQELERIGEIKKFELGKERIVSCMNFLESQTKASWYIDNRVFESARRLYEIIKPSLISEEEEKEIKLEESLRIEAIVRPENEEHMGYVDIIIRQDKVIAKYPKDDSFRTLVKTLGYTWEGQWEKEISETTGTAEERAAELGNRLLNAGFAISILDDVVRRNAISGKYDPECKRWIFRRKDTNKLAISWPKGESEKIYKDSRKIPTSQWSNPSVLIDISRYIEVKDFADMHGFRFTKAAANLIEQYEKEYSAIKKVSPEKAIENKKIDVT